MSANGEDVREQLRQRLQQDPRQQLKQRLQPSQPTETGGVTASGQFLDETLRSVVDTALKLGDIGITSVGRLATGQPLIDSSTPDLEGAPPRPSFLEFDQRKLPTAEQVEAGAAAFRAALPGGTTPQEAFRNELDRIEQARQAFPTATQAGRVAGDVASLLTGRFPVRGLVRSLENRLAQRSATRGVTFGEDVQRVFTSSPMRSLARGAGRSVETGLEAAVLEIIDGDDPLEAAAFAAGGQAMGSAFLNVATKPKWVATALITGGAIQMLKSATPGGNDFILESIESGFSKVAYGVGLGALAAVGGATRLGRGNPRLADATRDMLDGLSAAHRGTILSVLTDWNEADPEKRQEIEQAIQGAADPEFEGRTELQREVVSRLRASVPSRGSVSGVIERDTRESNAERTPPQQ